MRVLVVTVVHHPQDARIRYRQIEALLAAGHDVTYAAPFDRTDGPRPAAPAGPGGRGGLTTRALPRAAGRHRLPALRAARRLLTTAAPAHDVVLLHDPELLLAACWLGRRAGRPVVVWDVHEDTAAALTLKPWLPHWLRGPVAAGVRAAESWAERRFHLLLAEDGYRDRFAADHPVVPNSTWVPARVPPPGASRAVYVGHCTAARGVLDLIEVGRLLRGSGVRVEVVGTGDPPTVAALREADARGDVDYRGFLPNAAALARIDGALAGLSLLHDEPNYRHSRPTKVIEYLAHGVPVVTTPTPPARALVEGGGPAPGRDAGIVVPFEDPAAAAAALLRLRDDPQLRLRCAAAGRATAGRDHDWARDGATFVGVLQRWVSAAGGPWTPPSDALSRCSPR